MTPSPATQAPFTAPTEVATISSGRTPASPSAASVPAWAAPRFAPPESTTAVVNACLLEPKADTTSYERNPTITARRRRVTSKTQPDPYRSAERSASAVASTICTRP